MEFYSPSEKIKRMRKRFRVNQSELECTNMTRAYISMMESGRRNVSKGSSKLLAERFNNIAKRIHLDLSLDDEFFSRKPYEDARHYCENELQSGEELNHKKLSELIKIEKDFKLDDLLAKTLKLEGILYRKEKEYSKAFVSLTEALGVYKELRNIKDQPEVYIELGDCKYRKGNYEDAIFHYKNAITYSLESDNHSAYLGASRDLSLCYAHTKNFEKCIAVIDDNILNSNKELDKPLLVIAKVIKANALFSIGKEDKAVEQYFELVELVKDYDQPMLALLYHNIAEYYYNTKDYDKSLFYISQAQTLKVKCDKATIATTLSAKAKVMFKRCLYDESFMIFDLAIDMAEEYKRYDFLLEGYRAIAELFEASTYLDKVKERMLRLLSFLEENDIEEGRSFALYKLIEISTRQGNSEESMKYLQLLKPLV